MGKGFKDRDGKFHPISNYVRQSSSGHRDNQRMIRGANTAQILGKAISDFAEKRRENFARQKEIQRDMFQKELEHRRRFEKGIINSYLLARKQHITDPQQLKKFIYSKNPDLEDDKDTLRFVQSIVNDFKKQLTHFEESIAGKKEAVQKQLREEFEKSLKESEVYYDEVAKEQKAKLDKDLKAELEKSEGLLKKEKEKREKLEQAMKEREEKEKEYKKAQQESKSEEEVKQKKEQFEQAEKKAETAQSEEAKIEKDILEELKDIETESKEPVEYGFPEGII